MSTDPTRKQQEILDFIGNYYRKHGHSPSFRDISSALKVSVGTVQDHLISLQNKGMISWIPNTPRSLQLRKEHRTYSTVPLPLLGTISAGEGITIFEEPSPESIDVPSPMITSGFNHYCLQVSGFSMNEDGILDGDIIVVRQQSAADNGDTVVAAIKGDPEEKATLKRYYRHANQVELRPRNQNLRSRFFRPDQVEIRGKFRGLIRREN